MLELFVIILKQLLIEELYAATAAELNHAILPGEKGLVVKVNGFNQKLPVRLLPYINSSSSIQRLINWVLMTPAPVDDDNAVHSGFSETRYRRFV